MNIMKKVIAFGFAMSISSLTSLNGMGIGSRIGSGISNIGSGVSRGIAATPSILVNPGQPRYTFDQANRGSLIGGPGTKQPMAGTGEGLSQNQDLTRTQEDVDTYEVDDEPMEDIEEDSIYGQFAQ